MIKSYRDLQLNQLKALKNNGQFKMFKALKRIDFSNNQLTFIEEGVFEGAESVKEL